MKECIKMINNTGKGKKASLDFLAFDKSEKIKKYHESFPQYKKTPLEELKETAKYLGINKLFIKDESKRFGLNSFKGLGGSYAIGSFIAERAGLDGELTYENIISDNVAEKIKDITFVTATDGNHGRGVAWTARQLGVKAVVYMPKGSSEERLYNIKKEGAHADITDMNYDEAVHFASKMAEEKGWTLIQDTAWNGYEEIPAKIMQGYMTMALETYEDLIKMSCQPTHIFIQAGVGSLAASVCGFFYSVYKENCPKFIVVEPNKADCIFRSAGNKDGTLYTVEGDMDTIMAGLACGEVCTIGWEVLKDYVDYFISCPDYISAKGVRVLRNPEGSDPRIISGESGAVGVGLLAEIMTNNNLDFIKKELMLNENSNVICFNTEGDTDKHKYRQIIWDGAYPSI